MHISGDRLYSTCILVHQPRDKLSFGKPHVHTWFRRKAVSILPTDFERRATAQHVRSSESVPCAEMALVGWNGFPTLMMESPSPALAPEIFGEFIPLHGEIRSADTMISMLEDRCSFTVFQVVTQWIPNLFLLGFNIYPAHDPSFDTI